MYADGAPWDEITSAVPWARKTITMWASNEGVSRGANRHNDIADAADLKIKHSYDDHEKIAVEIGARVLSKHRRLLRNLRTSLVGMLEELDASGEEEAENAALVQEFYAARAIRDPLGAARYKAKMERALEAISLPGRVRTMDTLVKAASSVIDQERKAYRMDKEKEGPGDYEKLLREINEEKRRIAAQAEEDQTIIEGESRHVR